MTQSSHGSKHWPPGECPTCLLTRPLGNTSFFVLSRGCSLPKCVGYTQISGSSLCGIYTHFGALLFIGNACLQELIFSPSQFTFTQTEIQILQQNLVVSFPCRCVSLLLNLKQSLSPDPEHQHQQEGNKHILIQHLNTAECDTLPQLALLS